MNLGRSKSTGIFSIGKKCRLKRLLRMYLRLAIIAEGARDAFSRRFFMLLKTSPQSVITMSEGKGVTKLRQLFAREARAMEAAAAGDESFLADLDQIDLNEPESMEDLEDPELFAHISVARTNFRRAQDEVRKIPSVEEIETDHTAYARSWSAFKDKLYAVDMSIKALKTDNEAVKTNLDLIQVGKVPPRFPDDPVEMLTILGEWVELNTTKMITLMDANQRLIIDTNTNYRGYENIFGKMHKAIKAQENVIRQQTDIINKLTQRNVRASGAESESAAESAAECKPSAPAAGSA